MLRKPILEVQACSYWHQQTADASNLFAHRLEERSTYEEDWALRSHFS
jgi:hypothetical protein